MKISIVTVSYNSANTISDTLKSVASQSHNNLEHIVVDGASTDETLNIIARDGGHLAQVISERDGGIYDAMNKGLALATGDVVGFLNSDDLLASSDGVSAIAEAMADGAVDAAYSDLAFVDPKRIDRVVRYWRPGPYTSGACARGWMAPHPTFYVRRELLLRAGGFNLDYRLQSDFELMLRLFEIEKITARYLPQMLVRMRVGGATTGSLRNIVRGNIEAAKACKRNGFPGGLPFIMRKIAGRLPQLLSRPRS